MDTEPWFADLNPREQAQVRHAVEYATNHSDAGVPGHGQFMLIAKLAAMLATAQIGMYPVPADYPSIVQRGNT